MGAQRALAGNLRELAVDRELAADDIVGDVEQLQRGAEIVGLEDAAGATRLAETQRHLMAVEHSRPSIAAGLPGPARCAADRQ